ncbi:L-serine ammonia-lyase, iron-sulfur-dependent subunit beta [Microaerobacter geothermalis]|uniref:L-serine ammonia-lyase, iron-sulfur-dependent subunit beta n=1 Tax=Microaerobacter geothermalis TaxID=674972 RepID=UPI001F32985B|nr:L-serine ammonia-lyase, iron-sulfur-dependent subunit beta [Microaerobacter geothermalis]MCF6095057.1 L-serine ammonia-lyase, iron-sulfur-dependent subunit beta [Microaerobacter geothermalis]
MKYQSVFDIIGPIMIGPSSSHTAGAARIGRLSRTLFGKEPVKAVITFYGSFAKTFKGHGTDVAIIGGILGFDTFDNRIVDSFAIAKDLGMEIEIKVSEEEVDHPNTARIKLFNHQYSFEVVGISIGGGKVEVVEVNGFKVRLTGEYPTLLVLHEDRFGMISAVSNTLSRFEINIGHMEVSRKARGKQSLMIIETDQIPSDDIKEEIERIPYVLNVSFISP